MQDHKFKSLYKRYSKQPESEVFATFRYNHEQGEDWDTPFERLANITKDKVEDWSYITSRFSDPKIKFPILKNYLNQTFLRVQELGLISYSNDNNRACFNTGLLNKSEKDIYATFFRSNRTGNGTNWTFYSFADSYSEKIKDFQPLPKVATYIEDASDLVFDVNYEFEVNTEHIIEHNKDRLPEFLRDNRTLAMTAIEGATSYLKQKILRNYKIAIPHWYEGKIQLLLPLNLTSDTVADLALVAVKDKERKIYRIKTALTMDMAYSNARLICSPDRDWLNP